MDVGSVNQGSVPIQAQVTLQKRQSEADAQVVKTIVEGATGASSAPSVPESGHGALHVVA